MIVWRIERLGYCWTLNRYHSREVWEVSWPLTKPPAQREHRERHRPPDAVLAEYVADAMIDPTLND